MQVSSPLNQPPLLLLFIITLLFLLITTTTSDTPLNQQSSQQACQAQCSLPPTLRQTGPTRSSSTMDEVGNTLGLTRPHPYAQAEMEVAAIKFNYTVRFSMPSYNETMGFGVFHTRFIERAFRVIALQFVSDDVFVVDFSVPIIDLATTYYYADVLLESTYIADYNGFNYTSTDDFYNLVIQTYESAITSNNLTSSIRTQASQSPNSFILDAFSDAVISHTPSYTTPNTFEQFITLQTPNPNPNIPFCQLGCTLFYTPSVKLLQDEPMLLSRCLSECDHVYRSSEFTSVGYSDIGENARLECRDGCVIALRLCQPGYKCAQVSTSVDAVGMMTWADGVMTICEVGSYRDFAFDQVAQCELCPRGRYREVTKGRSISSCTKCPIGKYVNSEGSNSVLQCERCPAGRFASEAGLAECKCINLLSCSDEVDMEDREGIPFEGRW